jgi:hypothetical protein
MDRKTINKHLLMSAWFLLLVLVLSIGMVWTRTAQAAPQESQAGWDPIEVDGGGSLADISEDILGVGLSSVAVGLVIGLAGPWRAHMRTLTMDRMYRLD